MEALQLNTRLSNKSWVSRLDRCALFLGANVFAQLGDENSDEDDPFAEVCAACSSSCSTSDIRTRKDRRRFRGRRSRNKSSKRQICQIVQFGQPAH